MWVKFGKHAFRKNDKWLFWTQSVAISNRNRSCKLISDILYIAKQDIFPLICSPHPPTFLSQICSPFATQLQDNRSDIFSCSSHDNAGHTGVACVEDDVEAFSQQRRCLRHPTVHHLDALLEQMLHRMLNSFILHNRRYATRIKHVAADTNVFYKKVGSKA